MSTGNGGANPQFQHLGNEDSETVSSKPAWLYRKTLFKTQKAKPGKSHSPFSFAFHKFAHDEENRIELLNANFSPFLQ